MARALALALPGIVLAVAGTTHPMVLDAASAHHWWTMHVWLLPVFPLLAVALFVLLRGEHGPLAWLARVAAYGYAVFYTGLDVLSGIAAGLVFDVQGERTPSVDRLLALGNELGEVGRWAWLAAAVLAAAALLRRDGRAVAPGAVILVVGAVPFVLDHIYAPWGVMGVAVTAVGLAVLELAGGRQAQAA
ncbi:hypothetical protein BJF78_26835 [Pseudonocardia sp. CNS-139]|nr:hypothetical protein BJF78_26835 [Pseudonocardia sp. CNS-139]